MKSVGAEMFALPKIAPRRTPVPDAVADAFVQAERPASIVTEALAKDLEATPVPQSSNGAGSRLSVDIPTSTLRRLKIRAIERGQTVREYVLGLLTADGLAD